MKDVDLHKPIDIGSRYDNDESFLAIEKEFNSRLAGGTEEHQFDFEHGQWWVTDLGTGRQWSVIDTADGFDFEQVSWET